MIKIDVKNQASQKKWMEYYFVIPVQIGVVIWTGLDWRRRSCHLFKAWAVQFRFNFGFLAYGAPSVLFGNEDGFLSWFDSLHWFPHR
jgi:hypothetical protein